MAISEIVCGSQGHKITSVRINDKLLPMQSGVPLSVAQYAVLCSACGLDLEQIKELDKKPPKRVRKPKAANQEAQ